MNVLGKRKKCDLRKSWIVEICIRNENLISDIDIPWSEYSKEYL